MRDVDHAVERVTRGLEVGDRRGDAVSLLAEDAEHLVGCRARVDAGQDLPADFYAKIAAMLG